LPDGLFSNQKSQFGKISEDLRLENVNIFYSHWEYFTHIWIILWPVGTFCAHLVRFSGFGIMFQEKSGNPGRKQDKKPIKLFFFQSEVRWVSHQD
jgi:hypothetical protein